ncbi:MAG: YfhO family protein [Lentisphaerae bacterium]|nr:YfhO family protein [Lentisphaerota bacterium]
MAGKKQKKGSVLPEASVAAGGPPVLPVWLARFVWGLFLAAGLLALWAMFTDAESSMLARRLAARGWGDYSVVIVSNKVTALWHAAGMALLAAVLLRLCRRGAARWRRFVPWLLVALVALDALWLSRHYIKTMPRAALAENEVVRLLRQEQPDRRVALTSQDGFYNFWLSVLLPYHGIRTVNITQMPRMTRDYQRFLEAVGRHPLRFWQLLAVSHVLAPAQFWNQVSQDPSLREALEVVYAYNVASGPGGAGVTVQPATGQQPGQHAVLRFKAPAPRYALVADWQVLDDEAALRRLVAPDFEVFNQVLVPPEWAEDLPPAPGEGAVGMVRRSVYRSGYIRLSVSCAVPAMLRISEKYNPQWRAWVNGEQQPVRRVDYLFQGVLLEPGLHEVTLRFAPPQWTLWLQLAALLVCLAAAWRMLRAKPPSG